MCWLPLLAVSLMIVWTNVVSYDLPRVVSCPAGDCTNVLDGEVWRGQSKKDQSVVELKAGKGVGGVMLRRARCWMLCRDVKSVVAFAQIQRAAAYSFVHGPRPVC